MGNIFGKSSVNEEHVTVPERDRVLLVLSSRGVVRERGFQVHKDHLPPPKVLLLNSDA